MDIICNNVTFRPCSMWSQLLLRSSGLKSRDKYRDESWYWLPPYLPSTLLPPRRHHQFKWKDVVRRLKRMWLGRCILTHWYIRNSDYLTYLQIVHLLKRGVYHLRAPRLVVRLRSRLDAIGLFPLWKKTLVSSLDSQSIG